MSILTGYAKNSFQVQVSPSFRWAPWMNRYQETDEDLKITSYFAGWFFIQLRWICVN